MGYFVCVCVLCMCVCVCMCICVVYVCVCVCISVRTVCGKISDGENFTILEFWSIRKSFLVDAMSMHAM